MVITVVAQLNYKNIGGSAMESIKMSTLGVQKATEESKIEETKSAENTQNKTELTDNTKTVEENKQQIETEPKQEKKAGIVIVRYIGNSIWNDSKSKKWANKHIDGTSIENERTFTTEEYESRDDIKFMVSYGEMTIISV